MTRMLLAAASFVFSFSSSEAFAETEGVTAKATGTTIGVLAKNHCTWFPEITTDSTTYVLLNSQ